MRTQTAVLIAVILQLLTMFALCAEPKTQNRRDPSQGTAREVSLPSFMKRSRKMEILFNEYPIRWLYNLPVVVEKTK